MRITKNMVKLVKEMEHSKQIMQHYNLYKFYKEIDSEKADYNKECFLILGKFKTTR